MSKFMLAPQPLLIFILYSRVFPKIIVVVDKLVDFFLTSSFLESFIFLFFLSRTNVYLNSAFLTKSKAHEGLFPHVVLGQLYILNQISGQFGHFLIKSLMSIFPLN